MIEQTLHGYASGHHLVASSIKLSEKSKLKMEILSDLSGPEIQSGFKEYYTGYFLPEDHKAVLSYTWYADEMERPGCVWTHSLLIEPSDLRTIGVDIYQLINMFCRPSNSIDFLSYNKQIFLEIRDYSNSINMDNAKLQYLIWAIWGNKSPAIILADNSNDYAKEIINLWTRQNNDLKQGFSFSTGSLAIRKFEKDILSLQVVPRRILNNVLRIQDESNVLKEISDIKTFPVWVVKACELQLKDAWEDINKFRSKFGIQYLRSESLVQFVKLYVGAKAEIRCLNIAEGLNIIEKIFPTNEKEEQGSLFIELYSANEFREWISEDNSLKVLVYLVGCKWLTVNSVQLEKLINQGLILDSINSKKLVRYLKNETSNIGETMLKIYANTIPQEMFEDFTDMELDMCSLLITLNPAFAQCEKIWKQSRGFQQEILQCLKNQMKRVDLIDNILTIVLDNSLFDFGKELYGLYGEKSINIFVDYLLGFRILASEKFESIKEVCKEHDKYCVQTIETKYNELDYRQLIMMLEITDPYSYSVAKMNDKLWIQIFDKINISIVSDEDKMTIALFYFPVILQSKSTFPLYIVGFAFEIIHSSVARQSLPSEHWRKIEKLLPENSWLNQWDKCKRLRKAVKRKGYKLKAIEDKENFDIHKGIGGIHMRNGKGPV
ncbi:hypothetical protein [Desulfosporosinus sp. I2]|uniref:GAP1-N1 domain-containing protein n=1 Tax=Desulfosporosinus sp. I2 TaxID=1617025 RepID=UPI0012E0B544|nr:hypothetical protein [Desulfosporosinus sp. I2]